MSKYERTLVILKPEVLERNLIGPIINHYEDNNLKPIAMKMLKPSEEQMREHYAEMKDKYSEEIINDIIKRMTRGNCIFIIFEGINVIDRVRKINGATDPLKAEINTIRYKWAYNIKYNMVHGSDSSINAEREIDIWFPDF